MFKCFLIPDRAGSHQLALWTCVSFRKKLFSVSVLLKMLPGGKKKKKRKQKDKIPSFWCALNKTQSKLIGREASVFSKQPSVADNAWPGKLTALCCWTEHLPLPREHPGELHLQLWFRPFFSFLFWDIQLCLLPFLSPLPCQPPAWPFVALCSDLHPCCQPAICCFLPLPAATLKIFPILSAFSLFLWWSVLCNPAQTRTGVRADCGYPPVWLVG